MVVYNAKDYSLGVEYMHNRKKPCLVLCIGNTTIKYATFNNENAAREFFDIFADMVGVPKIDWRSDDIPIGLNPDWSKKKE